MTLYFQFLMVPTLPMVRSCGGSDRRLDGPMPYTCYFQFIMGGMWGPGPDSSVVKGQDTSIVYYGWFVGPWA